MNKIKLASILEKVGKNFLAWEKPVPPGEKQISKVRVTPEFIKDFQELKREQIEHSKTIDQIWMDTVVALKKMNANGSRHGMVEIKSVTQSGKYKFYEIKTLLSDKRLPIRGFCKKSGDSWVVVSIHSKKSDTPQAYRKETDRAARIWDQYEGHPERVEKLKLN